MSPALTAILVALALGALLGGIGIGGFLVAIKAMSRNRGPHE